MPRLAKYSQDASVIAAQTSRAVNYLGVILQRQKHLNEAHTAFSYALNMNPKNVMARINQEFNANLHAGITKSIETGEEFSDESKRYGWQGLLTVHGPTDYPDLTLQSAKN